MEITQKLTDFLVNKKQFLLKGSHNSGKEFNLSFQTPTGISSQIAGEIIKEYFDQEYKAVRNEGEINVFNKNSSNKLLRVTYTAYSLPGFPGLGKHTGNCEITIHDLS